jgi:beta-galactosidase
VYANGKLAGSIDRRLEQTSLAVSLDAPETQLDILVENTGRINFGESILGERIGILGNARVGGKTLTGWEIFTLPMAAPDKMAFTSKACEGACFYRASWQVERPADTYLDTRELGKGMVWINGKTLGRFWSIGPQGSLYVPASWLHAGANEIIIFDQYGKMGRSVKGIPNLITDFAASK